MLLLLLWFNIFLKDLVNIIIDENEVVDINFRRDKNFFILLKEKMKI